MPVTQKHDAIVHALRDLVGTMYARLYGAYGSDDGYGGELEYEIQAVAKAIAGNETKKVTGND